MHAQSLHPWQQEHAFLGDHHLRYEHRTWLVVGLTASMMIIEIVGGIIYGSMALLADGWHMSAHLGALSIAALSYRFARLHVADPRFSFGTGKIGELTGYSSAMLLALIAALIGYQSAIRLLNPVSVGFDPATAIAVAGLVVNLGSAWLLRDGRGDHHRHKQVEHPNHYNDHNLRAAYLHVLADTLTSVLAIVGLLAGPVRVGLDGSSDGHRAAGYSAELIAHAAYSPTH
jgi:cation diffusion facilitator family transporter